MRRRELSGRRRRHDGRELLQQVLEERYLLKDSQGRVIEDARRMVEKVARAIAEPEAKYGATPSEVRAVARRFTRAMRQRVFLPNSPTLMNAGRPCGLLSACFVLGIEDSVDGIFETAKLTALVQRAGGGTGFAFDTLWLTGDYVSSSGGVTSGPISFWRVFAEAMKAIQQGAHRRGAGNRCGSRRGASSARAGSADAARLSAPLDRTNTTRVQMHNGPRDVVLASDQCNHERSS